MQLSDRNIVYWMWSDIQVSILLMNKSFLLRQLLQIT